MGKLRVALVLLALCGVSAASPGVRLAGHQPRWATPANDRGAVANVPLGHMTVHLARSPEKQKAFDALLEAQQTLGSPQYHQWLTPAQIGERFGASDADIARVTEWLTRQGFNVAAISNAKTSITFSGTTSVAARAFAVEFHNYSVGSKLRLAIDREPTIPAGLASIVSSISGLAHHEARPMLVRGRHGVALAGASPNLVDGNGNHYFGVSDFATIYNLQPAYTAGFTGTGQVIGIIGRANVLPADISNFGARMGVTMPTVVKVTPPGGSDPGAPCGDPSCNNDDQLEATLDVERAGSIAYGAKLEMIASNSSQTEDGIDIAIGYAIDTFGTSGGADANIINISFGECEQIASGNGISITAEDALEKQAAMEGISVFVSSGDSAAGGCDPSGSTPATGDEVGVNYIGVSAAVTCMGGTEFADRAAPATYWNGSGAALGYIPEGAWNDPDLSGFIVDGTGGGQSQVIAKPTFQSGFGPSSATHRLVPDISFTAANGNDPYFLCAAEAQGDCVKQTDGTFAFTAVGGTSAAAPDMAGVAALINQSVGTSQGNLNPTLYMLAKSASTVFHDATEATSGVASCAVTTASMCNNSLPTSTSLTGGLQGFELAAGFDEATGLGSVDVSQLISHWPGASLPTLTIDPTSLTVMAGREGTVALTPSGFSGPITFACSNNLPRGATCTFASTQLTIAVPLTATGATDRSWPWLLLIPAGLALWTFVRRRRLAIAFGALAFTSLLSCGGSGNGAVDAQVDAAPPVTVTVTITATTGAQSASAPLQLTVD
jgi:pseudomonalisin